MPQQHELKLPSASPKQQLLGKAVWNSIRDYRDADFFTLGYSGRSIDEVIGLLRDAGVQTLCDIRSHAVSMYKPAFSKNNLRGRLMDEGIGYEHFPQLGIPRDIRVKAIHNGSRQVLWDWYDTYVAQDYIGINLHNFFNGVEHPVAFMCSELDPHECHRHRLSLALEHLGLKGFDL
jgi:uncharacterized protein (DUF488 family)